jgi:hypothetical protein
VCLRDATVLVDDVGDPAGVFVFHAVRRTVCDADLPIRVAEEWKREVVLLRELLVLRRRIEADAEDDCVFPLIFVVEVPEPGTLGRSARGVGLRIEPEDDFLPSEVLQFDRAPLVVDHVEIGRGISNLEHACSSHKLLQNESSSAKQRHRHTL